ncbi:hypothetical protein C0J52_20824 [Blattella germanica]|nr:hypothetical protein C0J52_20824 [Blattella germanica]
MADPTIQTFCCHPPNRSSSNVNVLIEFHSDTYNTICLVSSIFGIIGAIYQILPRRNLNMENRQFDFSSVRGRNIIIWLAVADLLAALGVFVRSFLWMNYKRFVPAISDSIGSIIFCAVSSAWIQYFYMATWFWTLCYAIDMWRMMKAQRQMKTDSDHAVCYHLTSWFCPAILTLSGLVVLYVPNANCHNLNTMKGVLLHILPNYCVTFLPMVVIMIVNPVLYYLSSRDVEFNIAIMNGQYTQRERNTVDAIKMKFFFFTLVFYMCWIPNLLCGILLWSLWIELPRNIIIMLWYFMAVMNPLQALLNSIVYRKWSSPQEVYIPCLEWRCSSSPLQESSHSTTTTSGENTPLLQSHEERLQNPAISINGSS